MFSENAKNRVSVGPCGFFLTFHYGVYEFVLRRSGRSVSGNRFWKRYLVQIFLQLSANYIVLLILCHFDPS